MDENMTNTEIEVTTEVSNQETEITIEDFPSAPSKGFIALAVGSIAAVAVGVTIAIKKHKKKKANALEEEIFEEPDFCEEDAVEESENDESKTEFRKNSNKK